MVETRDVTVGEHRFRIEIRAADPRTHDAANHSAVLDGIITDCASNFARQLYAALARVLLISLGDSHAADQMEAPGGPPPIGLAGTGGRSEAATTPASDEDKDGWDFDLSR